MHDPSQAGKLVPIVCTFMQAVVHMHLCLPVGLYTDTSLAELVTDPAACNQLMCH